MPAPVENFSFSLTSPQSRVANTQVLLSEDVVRQILIFFAILFGFTAEAAARGCEYDLQILNNADPALTASQLAAPSSRFEPVSSDLDGVLEARSETGVMWLRLSKVSGCADSPWMAAKFPYLTDTHLFAFDAGSEAGAAPHQPEVREVSRLPFLYPAWPLGYGSDSAARDYLLRIDYPDKVILPLHIAAPQAIAGEAVIFAFVSLALIILLAGQAVQAILIYGGRSRPDSHAFIGFAAAASAYVFISSGFLHALTAGQLALDMKSLLLISQAALVWMAVEFVRTSVPSGAVFPLGLLLRGLQHAAALTILAPYLWAPLASVCFLFAFLLAPLAIFGVLAWRMAKGETGAAGLLLAWSPTLLATIWVFSRLLGLTPYLAINHYIVGIALFLTSLRFNAIVSLRYRRDAHAARHDTLTDLPNRRALEDVAERYEAGRFSIHALAMIDLRKFKAVNDTFGHAVGDRLLAHIGHNARRILPKGAEIYRIGGDEFVLLVEKSQVQLDLQELTRTLSDDIAEPLQIDGQPVAVRANIGAVIGPIPDGTPFRRLLKRADELAYCAKSRDETTARIEVWDPLCVSDTLPREAITGAGSFGGERKLRVR